MPKASFQVFTDKNTKIIPSSSAGISSSGTHSTGKVYTERVENIQGSVAGAGSGEFHNYLNARKRERDRLEEIDQSLKEAEERRNFQEKVLSNKRAAEEKTQKNAAKRQKKKEKRKLRKLENGSAKSDNDVSNSGDESSDEGEKRSDVMQPNCSEIAK